MKKIFIKNDWRNDIMVEYEVTGYHPEWGNYHGNGYIHYTDLEEAEDFNLKNIVEDIIDEVDSHGLYFEYEVVLVEASRYYHRTYFFKGTCKEDIELTDYRIKPIDNI